MWIINQQQLILNFLIFKQQQKENELVLYLGDSSLKDLKILYTILLEKKKIGARLDKRANQHIRTVYHCWNIYRIIIDE